MTVEVCASSLSWAVAAEKAGADRVELCSELLLGGVTPSFGLISKVLECLDIPVYVLIRPRSGDFTYTKDELEVMVKDVEMCKRLGCDGVVAGVLSEDHRVDTRAISVLMDAAGEMDFTFHRAFDWVPDQKEAVESLLRIGCPRILSSGGCQDAEKGLENLRSLHLKYGAEMTLMPGGGVNALNIEAFKRSGFREIHFSGSRKQVQSVPEPPVAFYPKELPDERQRLVFDQELIRNMVNLVK